MDASSRLRAAGAASTTSVRAITPDNLKSILELHRRWVESNGADGARADLSGADLRDADLERTVLKGALLAGAGLNRARLREADLREADLCGATFQDAQLGHANLRGSLMRGTNFRDANLEDADLSGGQGLLVSQFAGANLAGAILPEELAKFDGLSTIAEISKTTQNLLTSILLVCAYVWLSVASTTDAQLLNNSAPPSSRLPILGTDIPLTRFYMVAPLLLLCMYLYFHLGLQRLWEELAELPAIFPDGRPLDKEAYPSLLNVLVRAHFPTLRENRSQLSRWQARMSIMLAWGIVPFSMLVLWGRYLRAHDWPVTLLHIALLSTAVGTGVAFSRLASATLRGLQRRAFTWKRAWSDARAICLIVTAATGVVLYGLSLGCIDGVNPEMAKRLKTTAVLDEMASRYWLTDVLRWVPGLLAHLGLSPSAALDDVSLSIKPANWSAQNPDLDGVHGADLEARNLRHAKAYSSFLINAYMRHADIQLSDLREADLRRADLRDTKLRGTNFRDANLCEADLRNSDLRETRFAGSLTDKTKWQGANLRGADLSDAKLRGADLRRTDLRGAILTGSQLQPFPDPDKRSPKPSRLDEANLQGADLSGADLSGTTLVGANLDRAILQGTILRGADLRNTIGLTQAQVLSAVTDAQTKLPVELRSLAERLPRLR